MGGRYNCAAPGCTNNYHNSSVSFFRFPKDPKRALQWVYACGRTELLDELETLHHTARICSKHFESRMFLNTIGNRLQPTARPSKFFINEQLSQSTSVSVPRRKRGRGARGSFISPRIMNNTTVRSRRPQQSTAIAPAGEPQLTTVPISLPQQSMVTTLAGEPQLTIASTSGTTTYNIILNKNVLQTPVLLNNAKLREITTTSSRQDGELSLSTKKDLKKIIKELEDENAALRRKLQTKITKQSSQTSTNTKSNQFSTEFKEYCLRLYFLGPNLYNRVFSKKLCLPTSKGLRNHIRQTQFPPAITQNALELLKIKFNNFQHSHKFCTLCIDEIRLTRGLFYGTSADKIIGFEDLGNDVGEFKPASKALVIIAKGFYANWQQPIAYYFIGSGSYAQVLKNIILEVITELRLIDLRVLAVISNMTPSIVRFTEILQVTPESPFFLCKNEKIVFLYNTENLLTITRSDFMKRNFVINDKSTCWSHLLKLSNHDKKCTTKVAANLSTPHFCLSKNENRQIKIKYARDIFNQNTANNTLLYSRFNGLPSDAEATAIFIKNISNLYSALNGSINNEIRKKLKNISDCTIYFKETYDFFDNLGIMSARETVDLSDVPSVLGWKITINGVLTLFEMLPKESLALPNSFAINHNCFKPLFNYFKNSMRKPVNPTPIKFYKAYKKFFSRNMINSGIENCEENYENMSLKLDKLPINHHSAEIKNLVELDLDYQKNEDLAEHFATKISDYLIKKCSAKHTCETCDEYVKKYEESYNSSLPHYVNIYENIDQCLGEESVLNENNFIYFIGSMEKIFQQNFESISYKSNVMHELTTLFTQIKYEHPCRLFPYYYLYEMYGRIRLFHALKLSNTKLRMKRYKNKIMWKDDM